MKWFNEAIASPEMAAVVRAQAPLWARNGHVHTIVACTTRPGSSLGRLKTLVQQWNISILICCVACRPATFLCRRMFPEYFRHSNFQCVILRSHKFPKCVILCVHLVIVWGLERGGVPPARFCSCPPVLPPARFCTCPPALCVVVVFCREGCCPCHTPPVRYYRTMLRCPKGGTIALDLLAGLDANKNDEEGVWDVWNWRRSLDSIISSSSLMHPSNTRPSKDLCFAVLVWLNQKVTLAGCQCHSDMKHIVVMVPDGHAASPLGSNAIFFSNPPPRVMPSTHCCFLCHAAAFVRSNI